MHKYRPHKPPKIVHKPDYSFVNQGTSREELDLHKTINLILPGVETIKGDRTILEGREIDIYIPYFRTGIEYDGLAFHSDTKDPNYHLWKTIAAEKKDVRLIHIWSDLWNNRRSQVVDYLGKIFGKSNIIPQEECSIIELGKSEGVNFLNKTHIMSCDARADHFFGVYHNNYLIEVISFKEENNNWTFLQKAERSTLSIQDDLKQVLLYIKKNYLINEIRAAVDRSISDASDLKQIGFKIEGCTPPNPHWSNYKVRKLQERKTDDQMQSLGYHRFYDCGELLLKYYS